MALFLISQTANALNVQRFQPSTGYTQGFQLFTSDALKEYDFSIGFSTNYVKNPLEVGFATGARTQGVVDQLITTDFLLALGFTDWLTLSVDVPLNWYHSIAPVLIATRDKGGSELGDIRVSAQFTFFNANNTRSGFGVALIPFVVAPSGKSSVHVGDASISGGAVLAIDKLIKDNRIFLNVGVDMHEREMFQNLNINHQFMYGLGFQRPLIRSWDLDVIAEITGTTTFDGFFSDEATSPIEGSLSLRKKMLPQKNLIAHIGGGRGITGGYSAPDLRVFAGLSYTITDHKPQHKPKAMVFAPGVIYFNVNQSRYTQASQAVVDYVAADFQKNSKRHYVIHGHTDATGSAVYNERLAQKRAAYVKKALVKLGIPADQNTNQVHG